METGETIRGRYLLQSVIGTGAGGTSYLARDSATGGRVVLKALSLAGLEHWRDLDSLDREAQALAGIDHPQVPRYVESFTLETPAGPTYVLVRQYIPGKSLEQMVQEGWRGTEAEISRLACGLLRIIEHIHNLRPPVIHRDITPRNVVVGEDGRPYLVDFGGVQDVVKRESTAGMTVTGTPGYVPLEQFQGNATERSDLYAAGATILYLLSHTNPADLPTRELRIDFRSAVTLSEPLAWVLDRLLEPDEARRTITAVEAIDVLQSGAIPRVETVSDEPPYGSRIRVRRDGEKLELTIPERGSSPVGISILGFSGFWLLFVAFWTGMSVAMGAPILFPIFSIPFWLVGIGLARRGLRTLFGSTSILVSPEGLELARRILLRPRPAAIPLAAVSEVSIGHAAGLQQIGVSGSRGTSGTPSQSVRIQAGARTFAFGELLSDPERDWLRDTIRREIERCRA